MWNLGTSDFVTISVITFLEGILSIDNAVVLALLVSHLPTQQRRKALTYGIFGAIGFRFVSLLFVNKLLKWVWIKYVGGGYLLFLALQHFLKKPHSKKTTGRKNKSFWITVLHIELMDIAFAIDSILAAVALSQKVIVVFLGGVAGIIMMRFAANFFIKLLEKFPKFEESAYFLVFLIGAKLILEALHLPWIDFHSTTHPASIIFWALMAIGILSGFRKSKSKLEAPTL